MRRSWKMVHFIVPEFATMATLVHGCSLKKFLSKLSVRLVVSDLSRCRVSTHLILLGAASPGTLYLLARTNPNRAPFFFAGQEDKLKKCVNFWWHIWKKSSIWMHLVKSPLYKHRPMIFSDYTLLKCNMGCILEFWSTSLFLRIPGASHPFGKLEACTRRLLRIPGPLSSCARILWKLG